MPNPDKSSERATQDYAADFYENVRFSSEASRAYYDWFFKKLFSYKRPTGLILDNGCGNGMTGEYLKGEHIIGVDLSPAMVAYAAKRLTEAKVGDAEALPFEDQTFDFALNLSVLHHLPHPERAVAEVARVLKPGGFAIFEEVVRTGISAIPRFFLNAFSSHFSEAHRNFKKSELLNLIAPHLHIEHVQHYGYLAYALLGFPDVINFQKILPFKKYTVPALLKFDDAMERMPLLKTQSWNIIIVARKHS